MRRRAALTLVTALTALLAVGCNGDSATTNDVQKGPSGGPSPVVSVSRGPSPATTGSVPTSR